MTYYKPWAFREVYAARQFCEEKWAKFYFLLHLVFFTLPALLSLFTAPLCAQHPVWRTHSPKADLHCTAFVQDHRGFMWIGDRDRIFRYDGTAYVEIAMPADTGYIGSVTALFADGGTLWIGTESGRIAVLPLLEPFLPLTTARATWWIPEEGVPVHPITGFTADVAGALWFSTYGEGVYCWKNNRLYQFNAADDGIGGDEIYALANDATGAIWAGTDAGISICRMAEPGKKEVRVLGTNSGLPDEIVTALHRAPDGTMWIGTHQKGICAYQRATDRFFSPHEVWTFGPVTSLTSFGGNDVWAGTAEQGLVHVHPKSGIATALPPDDPMAQGRVTFLWRDREGWIWGSGARTGGLYSFNARFLSFPAPDDTAQAFTLTRKGLWLGTPSGLYYKNYGTEWRQVLPGKQHVLSCLAMPDGRIWAGTFGNGIFLLDAHGEVLQHISESNGLVNGSVFSFSGKNDHIWAATLGGVSRFDKNGHSPFTLQHELGPRYVYAVMLDSRGRVWLGADGVGLAVWEKGQMRWFRDANGIKLHSVYCLTEDEEGRIWFGTDKLGLFCYDGSGFLQFTTERHYLPSNTIYSITTTPDRQILIATEEQFALLNPVTGHVAHWSSGTGLPALEPGLNAFYRDTSGAIWIAAQGGLLRADGFGENFLTDPQIVLTAVLQGRVPVNFNGPGDFSHNENFFSFHFSGLWYTQPEAVRYRFRLEGFDPEWTVTKDPFTSYPNLPAGSYTFRVQASEHGTFEGVQQAVYTFTIAPPFWQTWWFAVALAVTLLAALTAVVRWRENEVARRAAQRREKIENEFALLKSQINPHFLFNSFNTLITLIEENPPNAVQYVEHLSDFYRSILVYREKDLITLKEEIALVQDYFYLLKKRFEQNLSLEISVGEEGGMIIPLSLQLLVENAVKHNVISASKRLRIEIFTTIEGYIVVKNNVHPKIKPEPGAQFGLQSLVNRYALLEARPVVISAEPGWFTVKIPLLDIKF